MGENLLVLLGTFGPASVAVALVILGLLSQRLGAVTKTPPYYRWFYVAAGLVVSGVVFRLLTLGSGTGDLEMAYALTFALGVSIGVAVAWKYWSWLFGERRG
jgi:hypothetical protein